MKRYLKGVLAAALLIHLNIAQAVDQFITEPVDTLTEQESTQSRDSLAFDPQNPKAAMINLNGCVECMEYEAGETFILDGVKYLVVDNKTVFENKRRPVCVSHVTDMQLLFMDDKRIKNISNWDVSNVENMTGMFSGSRFSGDISNWDVSNVTNMSDMFSRSSFDGDISNWNVKSVRSMSYMFYSAKNFNQDISGWNLVWVSDMTSMFEGAASFNAPIGEWNVSHVKEMDDIFLDASSFVQDLSDWNFRMEMSCVNCLGHNISYN